MKYVSVVGLPIYTIAKYNGMGSAPGRLRKAGLLTSLGSPVLDEGDVELPRLDSDVTQAGVKNFAHFSVASSQISESLRKLQTERAILLGGECSMVVGALAGLVDVFHGNPGMLWLDAHGDFNTPESSPSSYIGGMCLAMACGHGPAMTESLDKKRPLLDESRLVHLGSRALDAPEVKAFESSPATLMTMEEVRKKGVKKAAAESAKLLSDKSDWIACHIDVDVVDPDSIIAVNYPTPGGMRPDEVSPFIKALDETGKLKTVSIAAFNPALDDDGSSATAVVQMISDGFQKGNPRPF